MYIYAPPANGESTKRAAHANHADGSFEFFSSTLQCLKLALQVNFEQKHDENLGQFHTVHTVRRCLLRCQFWFGKRGAGKPLMTTTC